MTAWSLSGKWWWWCCCWRHIKQTDGRKLTSRIQKRVLRTYPEARAGKRGAKEKAKQIKEWESAIATLNPEVAIKITSRVVQAIMARWWVRWAATTQLLWYWLCSPENAIEITLDTNTRIQILDELSHLAGARKHQFAAFCRQERCLVVWADEVETLIPSAEALEARMIEYVWSGRANELAELEAEMAAASDEEKVGWIDRDAALEDRSNDHEDMGDAETKVGAEPGSWEMREIRPTMLYAPLISGLAIILTFLFIGSGMREYRCGPPGVKIGSLNGTPLTDRQFSQGVLTRWIVGSYGTAHHVAIRLLAGHCTFLVDVP
jgi:hypothetical protein